MTNTGIWLALFVCNGRVRDNKLYSSFALETRIERGITDTNVCLLT